MILGGWGEPADLQARANEKAVLATVSKQAAEFKRKAQELERLLQEKQKVVEQTLERQQHALEEITERVEAVQVRHTHSAHQNPPGKVAPTF